MSIGVRDLAKALDYAEYRNLKPVIEKAKFLDLTEMLPESNFANATCKIWL
jgi:predicted Ser/Thr protein kinase